MNRKNNDTCCSRFGKTLGRGEVFAFQTPTQLRTRSPILTVILIQALSLSACSSEELPTSSTSDTGGETGEIPNSASNTGSSSSDVEDSGTGNDGSGEESQDSESDSGDDDGTFSGACPSIERLGGFEVALEAEDYSSVYGSVSDGVLPTSVLEVLFEEGPCRVVEYANPFCDPPCVGEQACGLEGSCIPYPRAQSVGSVQLTGLAKAVAIEPNNSNRYIELDLPHPTFEAKAKIQISASGGTLPGFRLDGLGFDLLPELNSIWQLEQGKPLTISWTPPATEVQPSPEIHFGFSIDQHGISPQQVICRVPDTGSFEVSAALIDKLVNAGISGFPNGFIERRIVDSQRFQGEIVGCVDFSVTSKRIPEVEIVGHIPCMSDEDCPEGMTCNLMTETCEL